MSRLIILAMLASVSACFDEEKIPKRHHEHRHHDGASCDDPSHKHYGHEHHGHTHNREQMTDGAMVAVAVVSALLMRFCRR